VSLFHPYPLGREKATIALRILEESACS